MSAKHNATIVGVFEDRSRADQAVAQLKSAGFRDDQIGVAMRHAEGATSGSESASDEGSHAGSGAMTGVLTGLGLGALAGLGVLAGVIPVVGPAIAGGTLGIILSNAAAGAGIAGLTGVLIGAGVPEHEAEYYHSEFEAGRTIVTVNADARAAEATTVLRQFGAYDISDRTATGTATAAHSTAQAATHSATHSAAHSATGHAATGHQGDTIQVKEERLHAEARPVDAGEVRIHKEVHTENRTIEVPVQREEVVIERTPVHGRAASEGIAGDIREGEEIRIPVREEQVSVTKEAVVVEEVKVGKRVVQDTERVTGQVRKEEVKVEREGDVDIRSGESTHGTS